MQDFKDILKGMDPKMLEAGMKQATEFAKTAEGQKMIEQFKGKLPSDKDALLKMLSQNPDILKSVESFMKR